MSVVSCILDTKWQEENVSTYLTGNCVDGFDAVGDVFELESRSKLAWETVDLGDYVSDDGKHGSTAILDFTDTRLVEKFLVLAFRDLERVPVAKRHSGAWSVLKGFEGGG